MVAEEETDLRAAKEPARCPLASVTTEAAVTQPASNCEHSNQIYAFQSRPVHEGHIARAWERDEFDNR